MATESQGEACQSLQGNQEPSVVKLKVGRAQVSLWRASPWNVILFSLWCFDTVGWVKSWVFVCWGWQFDWSFARHIAPVVTITSLILSSNKIQTGEFWYWLIGVVLENDHYKSVVIVCNNYRKLSKNYSQDLAYGQIFWCRPTCWIDRRSQRYVLYQMHFRLILNFCVSCLVQVFYVLDNKHCERKGYFTQNWHHV